MSLRSGAARAQAEFCDVVVSEARGWGPSGPLGGN